MSKSHQFEICRAAYQVAREQGSPPVLTTKMSPDFIVLETKDGKARMEGLRQNYDGCCMWGMKLKCAEKWNATMRPNGRGEQPGQKDA